MPPRRARKDHVKIASSWSTAETVIDALEDAEDYAAFEMAVTRTMTAIGGRTRIGAEVGKPVVATAARHRHRDRAL